MVSVRNPLFRRTRSLLLVCAGCLFLSLTAFADEPAAPHATVADGPRASKTVARCGAGWLETIDGYPVLHLKGTPYEMGFQHGSLLRESIRKNMHNIINVEGSRTFDFGLIKLQPKQAIESIVTIQKDYVPKKYLDEIQGLAEGCGLRVKDALIGNFIPELFHCSGFAVMNSATRDGTLYHGRVLDYAIDWKLQEHPVVIVAEPDGGIPFVNVTYSGFIGCVTGMNAKHVSIGEMGGRGLGHWTGVPMAFLLREALEKGGDLDQALAVFRDNPRTCQYYYVVADGKTNRAVGMEASWDVFQVIEPGVSHPLLPTPVKDAVLLSAADRYKELVKRAQEGHGKFDHKSALDLMCRPVAMKSNLHNVLFEPKSTKLWIANATPEKQPAADQPYHEFQLSELLLKRPSADAPTLPGPRTSASVRPEVQEPALAK